MWGPEKEGRRVGVSMVFKHEYLGIFECRYPESCFKYFSSRARMSVRKARAKEGICFQVVMAYTLCSFKSLISSLLPNPWLCTSLSLNVSNRLRKFQAAGQVATKFHPLPNGSIQQRALKKKPERGCSSPWISSCVEFIIVSFHRIVLVITEAKVIVRSIQQWSGLQSWMNHAFCGCILCDLMVGILFVVLSFQACYQWHPSRPALIEHAADNSSP